MTLSRRWANQDAFGQDIDQLSALYQLPRVVAYGLVAQESGFNPRAYRAEPAINDASYGLTQILLGTAKGEGYPSDNPEGLYDPRSNLLYGFRFLRAQLDRTGGDVPAALSAYNGGWRPTKGYGVRLPGGQFANQAYVDGVQAKAAYFAAYFASQQGETPAQQPADATGTGTPAAAAGFPWWIALGLLGAGLAGVLLKRSH